MACWFQMTEENEQIVSADRKTTVTQITKLLKSTLTLNLEADELLQPDRLTRANWEYILPTDSPKLDKRRLENGYLVWQVLISAATYGWLSQNLRQHFNIASASKHVFLLLTFFTTIFSGITGAITLLLQLIWTLVRTKNKLVRFYWKISTALTTDMWKN